MKYIIQVEEGDFIREGDFYEEPQNIHAFLFIEKGSEHIGLPLRKGFILFRYVEPPFNMPEPMARKFFELNSIAKKYRKIRDRLTFYYTMGESTPHQTIEKLMEIIKS